MKKFYLAFIICFISIPAAFASYTKQEIQDYLNQIETIQADFFQRDQQGRIVTGDFIIKKPGKFRWDYHDTNILIVADGKSITYYDKELEQKNYLSAKDTIASLLAMKKITLGIDVEVLDFVQKKGSTELELRYYKHKDIKSFTLIFPNNDLTLTRIDIVDQNDNIIIIEFNNVIINQEVDDKIFYIKDNRLS